LATSKLFRNARQARKSGSAVYTGYNQRIAALKNYTRVYTTTAIRLQSI